MPRAFTQKSSNHGNKMFPGWQDGRQVKAQAAKTDKLSSILEKKDRAD